MKTNWKIALFSQPSPGEIIEMRRFFRMHKVRMLYWLPGGIEMWGPIKGAPFRVWSIDRWRRIAK